jgi:hypothetical protein
MIVNANAIYGVDLQATFDPAVMEVMDTDSSQTGVQMVPGVFLKPDFKVRNMADNKTGTLRYVVTQLNPTPPASGTGILLSIQFRGKTKGASSKLIFTSVVIADRRGAKLPVTTRGADLIIVPRKPSTPTPLRTPTLVPATPTLHAATLTRSRAQPSATAAQNNPTERPGAIATKNDPTARPNETAVQNNPVGVAGKNSALSDQALTYITIGGFSGSILLFGLSVWLLAAKRRKERTAKSK